jgi:hypothetical protein
VRFTVEIPIQARHVTGFSVTIVAGLEAECEGGGVEFIEDPTK